MIKKNILLGAHMSISGGFENAIIDGESIGCTAIQIFTKSNRQWNAKKITEDQAITFKQHLLKSEIKMVIAHASYLINIGSPDNNLATKSINAVAEELDRCHLLDIPYLILHPGSYVNGDQDTCLKQIAENIDIIFSKTNSKTDLLLETMAGQGTSIGHTFEQIATIIKLSQYKKRIGVCLDTCHIFAAGYDFRAKKEYNTMWKLFDSIIGLNKLNAIHINDSKTDLGSHVDRHADIGKGKIGLEAFTLLVNDKRFSDIPKLLETPKLTLSDHKRNLDILKSLVI